MKYNPAIVLSYFDMMDVPTPELEFRFHPERKWRFDFAWPDKKLALEVDGGIWIRGGHNRGAQIKKDWEKRNAAAKDGWRILYVEPKDLCVSETAELIRECRVLEVTANGRDQRPGQETP